MWTDNSLARAHSCIGRTGSIHGVNGLTLQAQPVYLLVILLGPRFSPSV